MLCTASVCSAQFVGRDCSKVPVCNYTIITLMECGNNFGNDTHPRITKYENLFAWKKSCRSLPAFSVCYESEIKHN